MQTPQPDTGPTSQEQLVAQTKTIHAGLVRVEKQCNEVNRKMGPAAPYASNQHWQNDFDDFDVIDGPVLDNGFKDPAAFLYTEGMLPGKIGNQATFDAEINGMTSPTVPYPASGNTPQPLDTWSLRTTCYELDGNPNGISYNSYVQQPPYTQWAGDASSDCPTTASGSGTLQDEHAEIPPYAGRAYDYTLGRWVYEDVTLEVPVRYRDENMRRWNTNIS